MALLLVVVIPFWGYFFSDRDIGDIGAEEDIEENGDDEEDEDMDATSLKLMKVEILLRYKNDFCWKTTTTEYLTVNSKQMFQRFQDVQVSEVDAVYYMNHQRKEALRLFFCIDTNILHVFRLRGEKCHPPMYVAVHGTFTYDPLNPFECFPRGFVYMSYDPRLFVRDVFELRCLRWNSLMENNLYMCVREAIEKEDGIHIVREDNSPTTRTLLKLLCIQSVISGDVGYEEKLPTMLRKDIDMFCQMRVLGLGFIWK